MRVAFVVQRYGTEVVGGAELHCRWIAEAVAERHDVEVLTTTATDYLSWQNVLPEGETRVNGVRVRRFPVARRRDITSFDPVANKVCFFEHSDEEERRWLEEHGPVTPALVEHLRRHEQDYDAIVFFSYRYWTTYFGMQVAPHKSLLVPTAEHDRVLYLRLFQSFFKLPAAIVFNTPEERELIERVTGNPGLPGEVVGTGIVRPAEVPTDEVAPRLDLLGDYFVYVGRIEPEKGCAVMIDHFLRWQRETRATATLALFGRSTMSVSENAHVRLMGVVPDGEKLAAIARCARARDAVAPREPVDGGARGVDDAAPGAGERRLRGAARAGAACRRRALLPALRGVRGRDGPAAAGARARRRGWDARGRPTSRRTTRGRA